MYWTDSTNMATKYAMIKRTPTPNWMKTFLLEPWEFFGYLWPFRLLYPSMETSESSTLRESVSFVSASSLCSVSWKEERNLSHLLERAITWWLGISTKSERTFSRAILTVLTTGHRTAKVTTKVPIEDRKRIRMSSFFYTVLWCKSSTKYCDDRRRAIRKSLNTL